MSDETGWLIEWPANENRPHDLYWAAWDGDGGTVWSADVNKAVRFSREIDANRTAAYAMVSPSHLRVSEHLWMGAAMVDAARDEALSQQSRSKQDGGTGAK